VENKLNLVIEMRLLREELITDAKAKAIVEKLGKPDDMRYEQKNAYDNLKKFVRADPKQIEALVEELIKMNKLRDRTIMAIANTLPEDTDDLRAVLHKEYSNFTTDEINLILEAVNDIIRPTKQIKPTKPSKKSD